MRAYVPCSPIRNSGVVQRVWVDLEWHPSFDTGTLDHLLQARHAERPTALLTNMEGD